MAHATSLGSYDLYMGAYEYAQHQLPDWAANVADSRRGPAAWA